MSLRQAGAERATILIKSESQGKQIFLPTLTRAGMHTGAGGLGQEMGGDPKWEQIGMEGSRQQALPGPKLGDRDGPCW